jgi:methyltransferase-like protein 23
MTETEVLATTAGDLQLEEYHLRLSPELALRILHTGAVLSHEDEQRFLSAEQKLPYGIVLWPAAIALAHEIVARGAAWFEGKTVLELGAGTGLPGIVAVALGAQKVVQTDRSDVALYVCKKNAARNGLPVVERIETRVADYTDWKEEERYDVILGSDILYAEPLHPHLRKIFEKNLTPGGSILLSDPFRQASFTLIEALASEGWNVKINKWKVGFNEPERSVGVFDLTPPDPE